MPSKELEPEKSPVHASFLEIERSASQSSSTEAQSEIGTLMATLQKQEQLQSIRGRELVLREKEFGMRERDDLLQLKERRYKTSELHEKLTGSSQDRSGRLYRSCSDD